MTKAQWRRLVVRAIINVFFTILLALCMWFVCTLVGGALNYLGVGA